MATSDPVVDLENWLQRAPNHVANSMIRRARNEIVSLQNKVRHARADAAKMRVIVTEYEETTRKITAATRREALEEAARTCEQQRRRDDIDALACDRCAAAIRQLNDKATE